MSGIKKDSTVYWCSRYSGHDVKYRGKVLRYSNSPVLNVEVLEIAGVELSKCKYDNSKSVEENTHAEYLERIEANISQFITVQKTQLTLIN